MRAQALALYLVTQGWAKCTGSVLVFATFILMQVFGAERKLFMVKKLVSLILDQAYLDFFCSALQYKL